MPESDFALYEKAWHALVAHMRVCEQCYFAHSPRDGQKPSPGLPSGYCETGLPLAVEWRKRWAQ